MNVPKLSFNNKFFKLQAQRAVATGEVTFTQTRTEISLMEAPALCLGGDMAAALEAFLSDTQLAMLGDKVRQFVRLVADA